MAYIDSMIKELQVEDNAEMQQITQSKAGP